MYAKELHPNVFSGNGQWYFWCHPAIEDTGDIGERLFEGPFDADYKASRAAHEHDLAVARDRGRSTLESTFGTALAPGALNSLSQMCRALNDAWWRSPDTLAPLTGRNSGELIALMHSELSEALEGLRKDRADEHLPHRKSVEVELADLLIRVFDFAGEHGLDLGGALVEKCRYNLARADHRPENRGAGVVGGKRF